MTKIELIDAVAANHGITKVKAAEVVDDTLGHIKDSVLKDGSMTIVGFGTFKKVHKDARDCTNPQNPTGPKVHVDAKDVVKFKASKEFLKG